MPHDVKYVFLLDRPGCGKSTICRALAPKLIEAELAASVERMDDFPILWAKFAADAERAREGKPRIHSERLRDGEYGVTSGCLDECLVELSSQVRGSWSEGKLIFIEFARSSYVRALNCFDQAVLSAAVIIYIECDFDTCWERNVKRAKSASAEGTDDHHVPRAEMERRYLVDDRGELEQLYGDQLVCIDNDVEGEEHLQRQTSTVLQLVGRKMRDSNQTLIGSRRTGR